MVWEEAEAVCNGFGAHLPVGREKAEKDFIKELYDDEGERAKLV